jgi:uncharacterized protein
LLSADAAATSAPPGVVDTDVHEAMPSIEEILPYLDARWHPHVTRFGWERVEPRYPYGWAPVRMDAQPPRGGPAGSDLSLMRAQLFDELGVSVAILNGFFHVSAMQGWYEFASALASAYNDWQIERWLDPEPRLRGSVHVVAHDTEAAVREIDRVGPHPQIVQVFLPTVVDRQYGDPRYRPIFEAAARHQLVVALHHGEHTKTVLGYPRHFIEWHTALPQANMCQLTSLVCNGVFDQLPDLKVVVLEASFSWLPHFMWRLDQQYKELRSEIPWVRRLPSGWIRENVRVATQPMETIPARHFTDLIDQMGSDRMLLFASDYPHYDTDSPERGLPAGLSPELSRRILSLNAIDTYSRLSTAQ